MPQNEKISLPKGTIVPDHIAFILDGNRRWARARGLAPNEGHKAGYFAMKKVARAARDLGIHTVTLWGFSTENWERPVKETLRIMNLIKIFLKDFEREAEEEQIRFVHLGRKDRLPKEIVTEIAKLEEKTCKYKRHVLNVALDYGGRDEIVRAVRKIVKDNINVEEIDEKLVAGYLDTSDQPYPNPDLFIRPSGEQRTSGLLPWQMTYTEYYWEEDHLPDMTPEKLKEAILDYSRRRRRFGGNDSVVHFTFKPEVTAKLEVAWWRLARIPENVTFTEYSVKHLKEQWGLSKSLATDAAKLMVSAIVSGEEKKWTSAATKLNKFYKLIKEEVQLAFEPKLVTSLEISLWKNPKEAEETTRRFVSEVYRISDLQATKAAHLRALAVNEKNLAERGLGEEHWVKAQDCLELYYKALKDRIA